ncbi:RICIN domain-containing protein [Dyella sp. LX-66]|uniref:RICIN domain-containing protein n=1 Tax=unclassified Dyella TaxID=2634549 RepID=UPI001BE0AF80|nr:MULTISPECIES: RICIN domain-containing protein [unclassified Dyella]MBT2119798.1 RICIN domain-containing protein [Dyella sp. LX-1]MBT2142275.1 RICIN domain-containing protein [Dyella sp. LX-66]
MDASQRRPPPTTLGSLPMRGYRLSLMLVACTCGAGAAHAGQIFHPDPQAAARQPPSLKPKPRTAAFDPLPLSPGPALVELSDIYALLTTAPADAVRARMARRAVDSSRTVPAIESELDVALVDARRLGDPKVRDETLALFDAGMPVAVFTPPATAATERSHAAGLFGIASEADLAIYAKKPERGMRVFSTHVDARPELAPKAARIQRFEQTVAEYLASIADPRANATPLRQLRHAGSPGHPDHLPIIELTDTTFGDNGQYLTRDVAVIRDSAASRDQFQVTVKTSGLIQGGSDKVSQQCHAAVRKCAFTSAYMVHVLLDYGSHAQPAMLQAFPETTGLTSISHNQNLSRTTSYGFNLDVAAEAALSATPGATIKTSFGYRHGKEHAKSTAMSFEVKDYATVQEATRLPENNVLQNTWSYRIEEKAIQALVSDGTTTPAMRQFAPQSYSLWTLSAARAKGEIRIFAKTSVYQRNLHAFSSVHAFRVSAPALRIDLDSPYLHREPVVILQSKENAGRCLVNDGNGAALPGACSRAPADKAGQWYLDAFDRYVSRLDQRCLTVHEQGELQVGLADCGDGEHQKWYWAADRINSKYNGGDSGWRLFVDGDTVNARIDPQRQQVLPNNPNHALLDPWSTYPGTPVAGATIATLSGVQPQVPDAWARSYGDVPSNERWEPVALRQYKEH